MFKIEYRGEKRVIRNQINDGGKRGGVKNLLVIHSLKESWHRPKVQVQGWNVMPTEITSRSQILHRRTRKTVSFDSNSKTIAHTQSRIKLD